jgi:hypothetical protein
MPNREAPGQAARLAQMLCDLVDTLLPGEGDWPTASKIGVQGVLAVRLLEALGESALETVDAAITACGGPLGAGDGAGRVAVLQKLEETQPKLFTLLRTASYLAYYENPAVILQVRSLGQPYQAMPIHRGYDVGHFDMDRDRPRHNRGRYVATKDVRRVDLSKLAAAGAGHAAD